MSSADAEAARVTLGGAIAAAARLPAGEAQVLVDAGRSTCIDDLQRCAAISVIGSLALAVFVAVLRREKGRPGIPVA